MDRLPGSAPDKTRQTLLAGISALGIGFVLMLLPAILPRSYANRFLVACGFIGICWGVCCLILGTWNWIVRRKS